MEARTCCSELLTCLLWPLKALAAWAGNVRGALGDSVSVSDSERRCRRKIDAIVLTSHTGQIPALVLDKATNHKVK